MSGDEIREITKIVGDDKYYFHFVHRINKEFEVSDEQRNSHVYVLFQENAKGERIGFCVIGHSPSKMKVWKNVFKEEGWIDSRFKMRKPSYELMYMYIRPEHRSKGYGKTLFKKAIEFTKENDIKAVYAYISDRTDTAMRFYKQMEGKIIQDFSDEDTSAAFFYWHFR